MLRPYLLGLKRLNDAGRELHADELAPAARFNLKILYRKAGKRGAGDAVDPSRNLVAPETRCPC